MIEWKPIRVPCERKDGVTLVSITGLIDALKRESAMTPERLTEITLWVAAPPASNVKMDNELARGYCASLLVEVARLLELLNWKAEGA